MSSTGEASSVGGAAAPAARLAAASHVPEQPVAPYLDAVVEYAFRGAARYHVPGHKGGPGADPGVVKAIGLDALAADVPQLIHGIDVGPSPTPYERAEAMAAEAFGAARSWFLTNGATQGNHALCLALAPLGARVVVQRNSHASVVDGLVLSGGLPSFVVPEYDEELGITHCVTPDTLAAALRETPDARAAWVVSPTYYGMAADIAGLAEVAHAAGMPLVVDQAWGPHFGFHEALPAPALAQGADAMLTSTHKIAGSLTQSAMLHIGLSDRIDPEAIARVLRLLRTTSPSSLLLASLDGARRQLALHGEQLLHEALEAIAVARAKLETIEGIRLVDASLVGRDGHRRVRPDADRDRRARHRLHRLRGGGCAAALLRRPGRAADAGHDRADRRPRRHGQGAEAAGRRHRGDRQADRQARDDGGDRRAGEDAARRDGGPAP